MTDIATLTPTIEELEAALEAAERDLANLQSEQRHILRRISEAAHSDNGPQALIAATARHDELPSFLFAAQVKVVRCEIALMTVRKEALQAQIPAARAKRVESEKRLQALKLATVRLGRELSAIESRARSLWQRIAQRERYLGELIAEHAQPPGAVVRSLW